MTTKITLASGATLEYEGDVLIGEDGSILLEGRGDSRSSTSAAAAEAAIAVVPENSTSVTNNQRDSHEEAVSLLLSPPVEANATVQAIDAMLNITAVHFDTFAALCDSRRFMNNVWRSEHIVSEMGLSLGRVLSRVSVLHQAGLLKRVRRGEYAVSTAASTVFFEYRDQIVAERERRHLFVLRSHDQIDQESGD